MFAHFYKVLYNMPCMFFTNRSKAKQLNMRINVKYIKRFLQSKNEGGEEGRKGGGG
jgi:hypothetical protein